MIYYYELSVIPSYYLHNISKPTKYGVPQVDLSGDTEAKVDSSLEKSFSSNQLCTERVMARLFMHYHCNVVITDRLRSMFSSKLMRMGKAMQTHGGKERTKLLTKWKESKWVLEFKENEFIVPNRKRKLDNPIIQSCKRQCETLEQQLRTLIEN